MRNEGVSFICEVKKLPVKGVIDPEFPYKQIAEEYERPVPRLFRIDGTEHFKGCDYYLQEISGWVKIPVLRKDFIIDEYQIYESKLIGADAVLLICSCWIRTPLKDILKSVMSLDFLHWWKPIRRMKLQARLRPGRG